MTDAVVVNIKLGQAKDVYIGRPSIWGNPYKAGRDGTLEEVIELYRRHVLRSPELVMRLASLHGKRLGCYCAPGRCHGDVLVRLARMAFALGIGRDASALAA